MESPARESPARDVLPVKFFLPNLKEAKESLDREKGSRESPGREARGTPPEGESSGGSGRTTPRRPVSFDDLGKLSQPNLALVRKKIRHFSGKKFDQVPTLVPLTEEIFMVYMDYLIQNKFNASDIAQTLAALPTNSVLEDCPEGRTVLHVASEHGVPALVEALLQAGHSPLCRTGKGYTPLHLAIFKDNMSVVKKLLAPKEDGVNEKTGQGMTPLHVAVMVRNYDAIRMIRSKKSSDFGLADNKGETALHLAANILTKASQAIMEEDILNEDHVDMIEGVESIINYLLDWIKKDELLRCLQLDKNKQSPLHTLAQLECFSIIRKISDKFDAELLAEFELRNAEGVTPFLICVGKMFMGDKLHMDHVMMMMDIEESVKQQQSRGGRKLRRQQSVPDSPLGCALTLLKRMGNDTMDLTHPSVHNLTALQILIKNVGKKFCSSDDERALVEMMLMKGANVLTTHAGEEAPINLVMSHNFDEKIFVLFIKHLTTETMNHQPSTINWKDEQGETVLHWAVSQMDEKRMEVILELGADIMVRAQTRDQDIEITLPGMQANGKLHRRTPLMVALKNDSCRPYFRAISSVGMEKVVGNVKIADLMQFFETHIAAAAATKNNQALRELCQHLSRGCGARRLIDSGLERKEFLYSAVHFIEPTHFDKTFHKTALAWANENDDPICASELLQFEFQTHESKRDGLECIKKHLTNDKLLYWMTRTYSKFYPTPNYIIWTTAIIVSILQLGLSYFFYIFDVLSDIQLTSDYADAYSNVVNFTGTMWTCAQGPGSDKANDYCFKNADRYPKTTYLMAYYLTILSMMISIIVYVFGITCLFDSESLTDRIPGFKNKKKGERTLLRTILENLVRLGIRIIWPFIHLYKRIRYEASRNKSSRRTNLIEFERIWIMVKTIEHGIENTVQLIIVLYLLVPFYDQIHDWNFQTTMQKTFSGIAFFMTLGRYEACLLEKVVGKLFINVVAQSFSLTNLRYLKYGMSLFEHLANMWPLLFSNICQIAARILVLRVFFVTAEDVMNIENKGLAIATFFFVHFFFLFCIKISFEVHSKTYRGMDKACCFGIVKFLINLLSSSVLYTWSPAGYGRDPRSHVDEHNTFLPQLLFQLLILVEHLVLVAMPLGLPHYDCLNDYTFKLTAVIVPCLWLFSILCLSFHYKNFHTWSQTNGPTHTCWGSSAEPGSRGVSCVTGFCCNRNLYKVTLNTQNGLKIDNTEGTNEFKLLNLPRDNTASPRDNGIEFKDDTLNSHPLLRY